MEELMKQLMEQMNKRFDKLENDIEELKQETKNNIEELKQETKNNQTENRSYFKHIESQLDQQQRTFQVISDEIKGINIDIEYLSEKTGKHDTEINNLNKRIQS